VSCPPLAVPPVSMARTRTTAEPFGIGAGVKVRVPAFEMSGWALKRALLVVLIG